MDEGIFIWLYSNNEIRESDQISMKDGIQELINDIRIFDDVDHFFDDLSCIIEENVFLWLGPNLSYLVNILKDFDQILYVYLSEPSECMCTNKIRGVFPDNIQLLSQLKKDVQIWKNSQVYLTFSDAESRRMETTTTQDIGNHQASFMWSQMLLETLLHIPTPSQNPHADLLEEARRIYANNLASLEKIDEFEQNYNKNDAIKWYTGDLFVYRLVNKALRTRDICLIFKFRFLIQDIYQQLKTEQMKTLDNIQLPITIYRCQFMTHDEFDRIQRNTKQLISVNTFLSTSRDLQVALMFFSEDFVDPNVISVVFEIQIDSTIDFSCIPPFADISQLSLMPNEDEVLLSMSTVMEVVSVEKINSGKGRISLRLCHHDHPDVKQMKKYLSNEIRRLGSNETAYIDHLGLMLSFMGENRKAEQMWNLLASYKDPIDNPVRPLSVYLARLNQQFLESETTRPIYENEKHKLSNMFHDVFNHPSLPDTFRSTSQSIINHFIPSLERSMPINQNSESNMMDFILNTVNGFIPSTHPSMVDTYIVFATIRTNQNQYTEALEYYKKAFDICQKSLDITHPYHTYILANMASIYMKINDDSHAKQIIQQFQIHQSTSPIVAIFALRISSEFYKKQQDWQAVIVCQQEILQQSNNTPNSLDTIVAYMSIGDAYYHMKEFNTALDCLYKARNLQLQHHSSNHYMTSKIEEFIAKANHAKHSNACID